MARKCRAIFRPSCKDGLRSSAHCLTWLCRQITPGQVSSMSLEYLCMLTSRSGEACRSSANLITSSISYAIHLTIDAGVFDDLPRFTFTYPISSPPLFVRHLAVPVHPGSLARDLYFGEGDDCSFVAQA